MGKTYIRRNYSPGQAIRKWVFNSLSSMALQSHYLGRTAHHLAKAFYAAVYTH